MLDSRVDARIDVDREPRGDLGELAAGHDDDPARVELHAEAARGVRGDRLAQCEDAIGRCIPVVAEGERPARGLDHVRRGGEVRLTDTEVDDRAAARRDGLGPREHLEGALGPERGDVGSDVHDVRVSPLRLAIERRSELRSVLMLNRRASP
ncbi:MAG: hypothetical protein QM820_37055 [Minicystis sp.]